MSSQSEKENSGHIKAAYIAGIFGIIGICITGIFGLLGKMVDKDVINFGIINPSPSPTDFHFFESTETSIESSTNNLSFTASTNLPSTASPVHFTENDINDIIGKSYWRCIDGNPKSISIDRVPYNYVVSFPFTRIDTDGNFYEVGEYVSGGGLGTGWLVSELPNFSCSFTKPQVNFEIINQMLGAGKWKCVGGNQPSGIDLFVVPSNFIVQSPINFVDVESKRYYQGDKVPAGKFARVWFGNDISQNECP